MKKLFSFDLLNGEYSVGTQTEIDEICKVNKTEVYNQDIADFESVEWSVCCGCELDDGMYLIEEGILLASEDEGIELISNLKLCVA